MERLLSWVEDNKCLTELSNVSYVYTIDPWSSKNISQKFGHEDNKGPDAYSGKYGILVTIQSWNVNVKAFFLVKWWSV